MKKTALSDKVSLSETIAIDERVRELKAQGREVISFGAGQPDAPTPASVGEAGIAAIRGGMTGYTSPAGTMELRKAICEKFQRDQGLDYEPGDIVVSAGAKQSIYMALSALVDPGEEVLIPSPYWVSYPTQVAVVGGVPKVIVTDESTGFKVTPQQLREAITDRTSCLILNSPSNPTGSVYTRSELAALAEVIVSSGIHVITDEIYERIVYDGAEHVSLAALSPEMKERTAVVNGVSKAYSMTGWRIGYFAANRAWAQAATALQSHVCGNPCSISQEAATHALRAADPDVERMVSVFARRRMAVLKWLGQAPAIRLSPPAGAFYAFPDFSAYFHRSFGGEKIGDDLGLARFFIDEAGVALVPGRGFGAPNNLRISYAVADEQIDKGLAAMVEALGKLE